VNRTLSSRRCTDSISSTIDSRAAFWAQVRIMFGSRDGVPGWLQEATRALNAGPGVGPSVSGRGAYLWQLADASMMRRSAFEGAMREDESWC
jgi:hypothetical protein